MMHHLDGRLSAEDAYQVMMAFLQAYGESGGGEDTLVDVLSGAMSYLWEDGTSNDPAMWGDWVAAFGQARPQARGSSDAEVTRGEPNATIALTLGEAYRTMTTFLDSLYELLRHYVVDRGSLDAFLVDAGSCASIEVSRQLQDLDYMTEAETGNHRCTTLRTRSALQDITCGLPL